MSENSEITEESAPLEIGKYLVQAREQHRLSQEQMAKRLNLTVQKLDDLEHDRLEKLVELDLEEINPLGLIASAQKIHRELGGH